MEPQSSRALFSDDPMWESFAGRVLGRASQGGAEVGEIQAVMAAVGAGGVDAWYDAWCALADKLVDAAARSAAAGHHVSAREADWRASAYYQASYLPLFGHPVEPRLLRAFDREVAAFQQAAGRTDPPVEVLDIPFEGTTLPAYFARVDGSGRARPTLICTNGYDSNIQEMFFAHAPAALRRGYNCLLFDGPGQGRMLYRTGMAMRPDWESVVSPVIDYALTRPEIDPDRMALVGWSFGGFLAPRAAAFEPRIAALIADPGQGDQRDAVVSMLPMLTPAQKAAFPAIDAHLLDGVARRIADDPMLRWKLVQRAQWVHGVDSIFAALAALSTFEVMSVAGRIRCPTLLTATDSDPTGAAGAGLLAAIASTRKTRIVFTAAEGAGGHCEAFNRSLYHQRTFDWLDETFGYAGSPTAPAARG